MSLVPRCGDCLELVTRCACPLYHATGQLPADPDEAMLELRGCTVAEDAAMRRKLLGIAAVPYERFSFDVDPQTGNDRIAA